MQILAFFAACSSAGEDSCSLSLGTKDRHFRGFIKRPRSSFAGREGWAAL